jgi:hypothetical protein
MSSLILLFSLLVPEAGAVSAQPDGLRMWMTVGERRFAITLADNAAARAFAAELPLTLEVSRSFRLLQAAGARLACVAEMNGAMQAPVTDRVRATSTTNGTSTVRSRLKRPSWDCSAWRLVSP